MIVDAVFVIAIAALVAPDDTELMNKSFSFQTLDQCRTKHAELQKEAKNMKDAPEFKDVTLFVSECVAVPLVKAN